MRKNLNQLEVIWCGKIYGKEGIVSQERKMFKFYPFIFPMDDHTWEASQSSLFEASGHVLAVGTLRKRPHLGCGIVSWCSSSCSCPCSSCSLLSSSKSSHCSICNCPISFWLALNLSCNSVSLDSSASHCWGGAGHGYFVRYSGCGGRGWRWELT